MARTAKKATTRGLEAAALEHAAKSAGDVERVVVQCQEIATATLTVVWSDEIGSAPRRARLAVLFKVAVEISLALEAWPLLAQCADPRVTMGNHRGVVQLELVDEADYENAARALSDAAMRALGIAAVRA